MKLKSCKEFEELQKTLKDYTYQCSRAEIKRVQACNDLGEYYTNDPHLKDLYAKKQEALKERREARKKRDEYRKLNTEWLESSFKRAFGNQAIVNITDYTCTYFATFNGTQIAATSYKGKLDRITVDNFHQTTLNNFMKMPLVDVVTKDNVRDFYEKWLN